MKWGGKQHPVETLVEWLAPLPLAGATVWACTCLGLSLVEAGALGVIMLVTGLAAMRAGGGAKTADRYHFEPATFEAAEGGLGELLLEAKDEILIRALSGCLPVINRRRASWSSGSKAFSAR